MHSRHLAVCKKHIAITLLLVMALLLAQWSGLAHRIEHAQLTGHLQQTSAVDGERTENTPLQHSCVAFDAAAVADSIHIAPFVVPTLAGTQTLALWAAFSSWDAPLLRHFSSRAPPWA